jgi:LPPG:FO 2-phospho-L-lactate transferase
LELTIDDCRLPIIFFQSSIVIRQSSILPCIINMKITALAGGVGAAKFLSGLVRVLPPENLTIIVNTGDDFQWQGLHISPDIDTITYTLAGLSNPETGWGIRGDSFHCLSRLQALGCDTWFQVGDRDLATHVYRTDRLRSRGSLTEVTDCIRRMNGVEARILPMTDSFVPTQVHTDEGTMHLQEYFVRRKCEPHVTGFTFQGIEASKPAPGVIESLGDASAIVVCPSNPFISINPILAVPGVRASLRHSNVIAVSPIIAGRAIKGPTAVMLAEMGHEVSAVSVAEMYRDFVDIYILDHKDAPLGARISSLGMQARMAATQMDSDEAKLALARSVLEMVG